MKTSETENNQKVRKRSERQKGVAAVEMALVLPLLLALVMGLFEFSQAIFINNNLTNMSREGANLATRTGTPPSDIMNALAQTAEQLDMPANGMIYVTKILRTTTGPSGQRNKVLEQYRWQGTTLDDPPPSQIWTCKTPSRWDGGRCDIIPALNSATRTVTLDMTLKNNEEVVAVEVYYDYHPVFRLFLKDVVHLYSRTLLCL